jgi:hypothetical protein
MQDFQQHTPGRYSQPSLAGMLAQQRQADIARAAEHRRVATIALIHRLGTGVVPVVGTGTSWARTLHALQNRLEAVRPAIARALDARGTRARGSRAGARGHTAPAGPNTNIVCCA